MNMDSRDEYQLDMDLNIGYCIVMACGDIYLEMGCNGILLTGHGCAVDMGTIWLWDVEMGIDWTLVTNMGTVFTRAIDKSTDWTSNVEMGTD